VTAAARAVRAAGAALEIQCQSAMSVSARTAPSAEGPVLKGLPRATIPGAVQLHVVAWLIEGSALSREELARRRRSAAVDAELGPQGVDHLAEDP
jgi:hypothetical protein